MVLFCGLYYLVNVCFKLYVGFMYALWRLDALNDLSMVVIGGHNSLLKKAGEARGEGAVPASRPKVLEHRLLDPEWYNQN